MKTALYKIENDSNAKLYIGVTNDPARRWADHLRYAKFKVNKLYNAMRKHGAGSFRMEVLHWCDTLDDAYELEQLIVEVVGTREKGYNTTPGGRGLGSGEQHPHYGKRRPEHVSEALRVANTGRIRPEHEKEKIAATMRRVLRENPRPSPSKETRDRIGRAGLGREVTPETRAKISASTKGISRGPLSEETKKKLSAKNKGRKHSPEAVEKIRIAGTGRTYPDRKPHSKETYTKIGAAIRATKLKNGKRVQCISSGEIFPNAREAAIARNVSEATVSMHCNGKIKCTPRFRYPTK